MVQATGQRTLRKKEVKLNNFFTLGSGIFVTLYSGFLLDFEVFLFSSQKLIKILHKLNINSLKDREKEELKNNLREANKEIQKFVETF